MNSTDSYCPRMKPSRGGHSGCIHGFDMTMKCLAFSLNWGGFRSSGWLSTESEVISKVTKSRGVYVNVN